MNRKQNSSKDIRDAVLGDIEFDRFELAVINTPQFQRMRGIRQLGLAHLVYPCAHHTRFEHSLGVAQMASQIVAAIRRNSGEHAITEKEHRFVRVLGLIHDIGHIPFGHTLEDERPIFDETDHHDGSVRLSLFLEDTELAVALHALGNDIGEQDLPKKLIRVMKHTHENDDEKPCLDPREELLARIVGNTICADLLDYLKRDPYFTGLHHTYDEKIVSAFKLENNALFLDLQDDSGVRHGVLSEILHLLRLRYTLGERVYYHPTKSAASGMISKAVELSQLPHNCLARLRDEELLFLLENASSGMKDVFGVPIRNAAEVSSLATNIRARRLYVPVYRISRSVAGHHQPRIVSLFFKPDKRAGRANIENQIAAAAGIKPHQVIVYCPDKKMARKAAMVEVLWPGESVPKALQLLCADGLGIDDVNVKSEIDQLHLKHEALWHLTVFIDSTCSDSQRRKVSLFCETLSEFGYSKNCRTEFVGGIKQAILRENLFDAIERSPKDSELDSGELRDLVSSDRGTKEEAPNVDAIMKRIIKSSRTAGEQEEPTLSQRAEPEIAPTGLDSMAQSESPMTPNRLNSAGLEALVLSYNIEPDDRLDVTGKVIPEFLEKVRQMALSHVDQNRLFEAVMARRPKHGHKLFENRVRANDIRIALDTLAADFERERSRA